MSKKEWTDAERKAFSDKMKQIHAEKKNKHLEPKTTVSAEGAPAATEQEKAGEVLPGQISIEQAIDEVVESDTPIIWDEPIVAPEPTPINKVGEQDYDELRRQISELQQLVIKGLVGNQGAQAGPTASNGKLVGTVEKFPMGKDLYPNPAARLAKEQKLARFAFDENYELNYLVTSTEYTTIDNVRVREPKFTLTLVRKVMDEDTGEPTSRRIIICNLIMHEDPDTARIIALAQDFDFDSMSEAEFLNEMRYMRMRDWLIDCFYPPKATTGNQMQEMVVGGRLVQYYEANELSGGTGDSVKIDFSKLPKIKF